LIAFVRKAFAAITSRLALSLNHGLPCSVHCAIEIDPWATHLQVSLTDAQRLTNRRTKAVPAFDELR
jgi:hypothetical protein